MSESSQEFLVFLCGVDKSVAMDAEGDEILLGVVSQSAPSVDMVCGRANRLADILATNERKLWNAIKAKDMNVVESLLAPDFFRVSGGECRRDRRIFSTFWI